MQPHLYDTMSREVKPLSPQDGKKFGFYCCGPTVYGPAHIGNFRTFLLQDVLRRVLTCAGVDVNHVRNITDVDDKTIRESQKEKLTLVDFTQKWTDKFHKDCNALNMLTPNHEPKAAEHIEEQIAIISNLIDKQFAYVASDGSVYFKVSAYSNYGELAKLRQDELQTQQTNSSEAQNLADEYERETIADFALWKAHKPADGDNYWQSPWGKGRPGWHIECSAMSIKYLGEVFDLHGGGVDLVFPHHENEIAQSCCHTGKRHFAKHWFHCTHLMVDGAKMSKSLGNLYTLDDLAAKGYSPATVRYALLSGHYRQQLNFTFNTLNAAKSALHKIEKEVRRFMDVSNIPFETLPTYVQAPPKGFFESKDAPFKNVWEKLVDDLNIPAALGELFSMMPFPAESHTQRTAFLQGIGAILYTLGIAFTEEQKIDTPADIQALAEARWQAKQAKNWAESDRLRAELTAKGWAVKDKKDGYDIVSL